MLEDVKPARSIRWQAAIVAAVAGVAVLGGAAGTADADNWKKHWKKHGRYYYGAPAYVVPPGHVRYYAPAPVIYAAPPPVVVYPQPVPYVPAYPAYYGPGGSLNIGVSVPLR